MLSVTIDEKSMSAFAAGQLDVEPLCRDFSLPPSDRNTKCVRVAKHGYILSRLLQPGDALLTVSLLPDGPISELDEGGRQEAVARLFKATQMFVTGRTRSIPASWRPYHKRNRLTFQADQYVRRASGGRTNAGRLVLEISQDVGPRVFAFHLDRNGTQDLEAFASPSDLLRHALNGVSAALKQQDVEAAKDSLGSAVTLDDHLPSHVRGLLTADDWYTTRLTKAQREFVDHPLSSSVRLVGPAGSGKTVALVVKCLRDLKRALDSGKQSRFLVLTHASSTAAAIEGLVLSMEPERGIQFIASDDPSLVITTLYSLANQRMRYELDRLTPVSLDGHEGRSFQADVLNEVIEQLRKGDWITLKARCSGPFRTYVESPRDSTQRRFFLWELLNEFACVLDAEGVRSGSARREQYISEKRKAWMMHLETPEERQAVLHLYDAFRSSLRDLNAIGGDQMISDFLNHLDSFRWEATRDKEGFDAIFVDELHLFNRQERMTFKQLFRSADAAPAVFMAYDAKQSPRDTFLRLPSLEAQQLDFWKDARLGKVDKIELLDVFRYSPQIAKALSSIDASFPGVDLDDEWPKYSGISKTQDGPVPTVCALPTAVAEYTFVMRRAHALQRELGQRHRVAVLCASNELFRRYLDFKALREGFFAITSREEVSALQRTGRRFIFSMPEYVAGLQFDTVLLMDVNRGEVPDGPYATAAQRKFVSTVYLGASRAERRLEIYATQDEGGPAPLLSRGVLDGAIRQVNADALSKNPV